MQTENLETDRKITWSAEIGQRTLGSPMLRDWEMGIGLSLNQRITEKEQI